MPRKGVLDRRARHRPALIEGPGPLCERRVGDNAASEGSHLKLWSEEPEQVTICQFSDDIHPLD